MALLPSDPGPSKTVNVNHVQQACRLKCTMRFGICIKVLQNLIVSCSLLLSGPLSTRWQISDTPSSPPVRAVPVLSENIILEPAQLATLSFSKLSQPKSSIHFIKIACLQTGGMSMNQTILC